MISIGRYILYYYIKIIRMPVMMLLYRFILFELSLVLVTAFVKAPGNLTLRIKMSELIDICMLNDCHYNLEFCVGSGRAILEQCIWLPSKRVSGPFSESNVFLAHQSFEVDNVRSTFYFNSNLTFQNSRKETKTLRFTDSLIKYDASAGTYSTSLSSVTFESMGIEIDVTCKSGFYPPFLCTKSCFPVHGVSACDSNGNIVCLQGYIFHNLKGECIKDRCKSSGNFCKNNSTCISDTGHISCRCQPDFFGISCEDWDPCRSHKCLNGGKCHKRYPTGNYECNCTENYIGRFCEAISDPCKLRECDTDRVCQKYENGTICVPKKGHADFRVGMVGWFQNKGQRNSTKSVITKDSLPLNSDDLEGKNRETVKLIQYPMQKDFTTISIIIVLFVFIVCCFGVTFWMQRYKYFQKRKKYISYPNIPPMPSVIQMPTYRSADDNFKRWHSLDDSSFYLCNPTAPNEHFSTMSYKSGSNLWPRYEGMHDSYRNWPQTLGTRMPMMNESSNFESSDAAGDLCESTPNNLEKMVDYDPGSLIVDRAEEAEAADQV